MAPRVLIGLPHPRDARPRLRPAPPPPPHRAGERTVPGLNGRDRGAGGGPGRGARGWRPASAPSLACARRPRAARSGGPRSREGRQRHLPAEVRGAAPVGGADTGEPRHWPLPTHIPGRAALPQPCDARRPARGRGRLVAARGPPQPAQVWTRAAGEDDAPRGPGPAWVAFLRAAQFWGFNSLLEPSEPTELN